MHKAQRNLNFVTAALESIQAQKSLVFLNQKSRHSPAVSKVLFQGNHFYLAVKHSKDEHYHIYLSPKWSLLTFWCLEAKRVGIQVVIFTKADHYY